jgi:aspartate racemase
MKKIGIVGGLGWRSTVDYYAGVCGLAEDWHIKNGGPAHPTVPEISIESLDLATALEFLRRGEEQSDWEPFDCYHREALKRLQSAGADFGLIASNTPHHRFAEITSGIDMPVLNIFEVAASRARSALIPDVLILGTSLTMSSAQIRSAFKRKGIRVRVPSRSFFPRIAQLIASLQAGEHDDAENHLYELVQEMPSASAVCLACTELGLALPKRSFSTRSNGITYFDPTVAHIEAALMAAVTAHENDVGKALDAAAFESRAEPT